MRMATSSLTLILVTIAPSVWAADVSVVAPRDSSALERLAAHEIVRYLYLRTGTLTALVSADTPPADQSAIIVVSKDQVLAGGELKTATEQLQPQQYLLRTISHESRKTLWIIGGSDVGALYGAYRVIEHLGVRFYLHGDVIPDEQIALSVPDLNEVGRPLFATRGIQPFHDFPEGPDWWDADDYLAYISQLAKMRMNFIGLHCYPEGGVGPEPLVWIGPKEDADAKGHVQKSYPSQWANTTKDGMWGYATMPTSEFAAGAGLLFPDDVYGPSVQQGMMPRPATQEQANELFDRTAELLRTGFAHAKALGLETCIGTETPLTIPKLVQDRLKAQGKDPRDPAVIQAVYTGMFQRIKASHPLDYYWLWTPEGWTWGGNKPEELAATERDIKAALAALDDLGHPFTLATCGWVLGPQSDRAALDNLLPKSSPMSCINRNVGHAADEPAFVNIKGRPKWVIPWMENDPDLVAPQPWVGRMRYDAADAVRLGCTGLLGIHWRTKAMMFNVSALASAGWDQSWLPVDWKKTIEAPPPPKPGPIGGNLAAFSAPVAGTDEEAIYQTVRYNMDGYRLAVPNGTYTVVLKFNEPHYTEPGKRVFGAAIQGKNVIEHLDLFAKVGQNQVLDYTFPNTEVKDGTLRIDFSREVEFPCIAGIVVTGPDFTRKINCGGPAYKDYEPDLDNVVSLDKDRTRSMPVDDFYRDYARASFGANVAEAAGAVFAKIDGHHLPEPSTWITGPGNVKPNPEPWSKVKDQYAFVAELEAIRPRVKGAGNIQRFDYWLNTYRGMAAMAELGCLRGDLDRLAVSLKTETDSAKKKAIAQRAVEARVLMARLWERLMSCAVAVTDTPGELGTIANLEQHTRKMSKFLDAYDKSWAEVLGAPLPSDASPSLSYTGTPRLVVPTVRTQAARGEALELKIIALDAKPITDVSVFVRPLGRGDYQKVATRHVGRAVHAATLPKADGDFEYYVESKSGDRVLFWPATAPTINQTVVVPEGP